MHPTDVIRFWFEEIDSSRWWHKDAAFDELIRQRFEGVHRAAQSGELYGWRATVEGRLAEIIVLDQFSRNMYRDTPQSFAYDGIALVLAQEAVAHEASRELLPAKLAFLVMPFMHSESLLIHEQAITLFSQPGLEFNLDFELKHQRIIKRFGRYPHRNAILGRISTREELEFLKQPDSAF